jgi:hypothetical protein
MKVSSLWSWGWAEWTTMPGEHDPMKPKAACVYLWTRDPKLCNGPAAAGKGFDRSRTEGQLILARGLRCKLGGTAVRWSAINPILKLTGDSGAGLLERVRARGRAARCARVVSDVLAAERSLVAARFGGSRVPTTRRSRRRTRASPSRAASSATSCAVRASRRSSSVGGPSAAEIADYRANYGDVQARLVQTKSQATWLGGRRTGYALASTAPPQLMSLASGRWASSGRRSAR